MRFRTLLLLSLIIITVLFTGCTGQSPHDSAAPAPSLQAGPAAPDTPGIPEGSGRFVFTDTRGNADRPIPVYTYRPASWNTSGPILIVMHGAGRSGGPSRDAWIGAGERYSCLVIAPEFSATVYTGDNWYAGGNLLSDQGVWQPRENWTYTAIEHLFDEVRRKTGARQETYLLSGFSAGGQFVHRMVLFLPEARYSRAVAGAAGVYAMPTFSTPYGFGLGGSPLRKEDLPLVFARNLTVMVGSEDSDPAAAGLATFPAAEAQGRTRLERAERYIATAKAEAGAIGVPLNWKLVIVPGAGHSESRTVDTAAGILFGP